MEKKVLGLALILVGLAGMFLSAYSFINGSGGTSNLTSVIIYLIAGAIIFFTGINVAMPTNNLVHKTRTPRDSVTGK
jgi:archaellum biogenesis protein FlaJ (TadC family)